LNKYKRKLIHTKAEELKLFHWTVHISDSEAHLIISNNERDEEFYDVRKRQFNKNNKSNEYRSDEIKKLLLTPSTSNRRRLQLQIELEAIKPVEPEPETVKVIETILNPETQVQEKPAPKKRGRPPKAATIQVTVVDPPTTQESAKRYPLRSRAKNNN
jgi:hypothetical protein